MTPRRLNLIALESRFCISWRIWCGVGVDRRQRTDVDLGPGAVDRVLEVLEHLLGDRAQVHRGERTSLGGDPAELEQVLDQALHALRGGVGPLQVVRPSLGQGVGLGLG